MPVFYDLDVQEQRVIWDMLRQLRERISQSMKIEAFDAGFVDAGAGDETAHTHVHLIPRIAGEDAGRPAGAEWVALE